MMARATLCLLITIEPRMGVAGMVKYAVQHQFHSHLVSAYSQTQQGVVTAKVGIDLIVIFGIVLMDAG
ncbi:hypothetical protein D3C71_2090460 [compost metagenome]